MPSPEQVRRTATPVLATLTFVIGLALIVRMALIGNAVGIVLGVLFAAAGAGRVYLARKAP